MSLLRTFEKRNRLEVLRMEVRLNKRQKIKHLFKTLDITADLTFKKLFKPAISKKILLHHIETLESKRLLLFNYKAANDKALLIDLKLNNPNLGPKQILQLFGLKKTFETVNPRELRGMFSKYNQRSWHRLTSDVNKAKMPNIYNPFVVIRKQLIKLKPLKFINETG